MAGAHAAPWTAERLGEEQAIREERFLTRYQVLAIARRAAAGYPKHVVEDEPDDGASPPSRSARQHVNGGQSGFQYSGFEAGAI